MVQLPTANWGLTLTSRNIKLAFKQITTGTLCHLEANMIQKALDRWDVGKLDFLFVENVGNLVCPSSYDLGEDFRLVLIGYRARKQAFKISNNFQ